MDEGSQRRERHGAGTAVYAPEGGGGQAREGKCGRGLRGLGKRRDTRQGRGEKRMGGGDSGRSPYARSGSRHRGRPRRSVRRYGRRRSGRRAASERRGTRRWRTWSASAVATSPRSRDRTPSTGWRWSQGGQGRGARGGWRSQEGSTAGSPVMGCGEREGRQNRAPQPRRGTTASGRRKQERGSQRSGHTGSAVQGRDAGQVEGGKGKQSGHGTQGKGGRQEGLQGKGHGKAGLHGVGSKGHGAAGQKGKGQGKESSHGYMGSPGKGLGWWGGVVPPAVPPIVPPFPPPPYPAMGMMDPPLPAYQGMQPQAHVQQRPQAGGTAGGAQEGKGEEHRRA